MKKIMSMLVAVLATVTLTGCKEKKKTDDIVVKKVETPKPQAPIRMPEDKKVTDVVWLGKDYQVELVRKADDSLRMVQDEIGQKFVDNRVYLRIIRSDGSVFFNSGFTKAAFDDLLDDDYRQTGILEGIVFDRVEGQQLFFAGSVCHPQTDEYIPFVVSVSNLGQVGIRRDNDLDTSGIEEENL